MAKRDTVTGPFREMTGRLKWFNKDRGFGFVEFEAEPDAFLHFTRLRMNGFHTPEDGTTIVCSVGTGKKGPAVERIISVGGVVALSRESAVSQPALGLGAVEALVKKYDPVRGFGFLERDNDEPDIFVHSSVLKSCGLQSLTKGQRVSVVPVQGPKGLQAERVALCG